MRRTLILGGTAWVGAELARRALRDGSEVTCLARGTSGEAPSGVTFIQADRSKPGAYDQLLGDWDEVIELTDHQELAASALDALAARARHWTLISTVSVYRRNDEVGADESAELVEVKDLNDYAQAKVAAERTTAERLSDRLLTVRPGLIVGPGDPSDRFGYWPARFHRGAQVLIPSTADRFVQVIDVADLVSWILEAGREQLTGTFNAVGHSWPLEEFFAEVRAATGFDGELVSGDDAWLIDHEVHHWAGPHSLPLWLPSSFTGFARRSNAAFLAAGGHLRPLRETIHRVLADEVARGAGRRRRSGLSADEETHLLSQYHASPSHQGR